MKTILLITILSACGAVNAAEDHPVNPSDCCWLVGREPIESCLRDFLDEPGACAHTKCVTTGYVEVSWPTDAGETACPVQP